MLGTGLRTMGPSGKNETNTQNPEITVAGISELCRGLGKQCQSGLSQEEEFVSAASCSAEQETTGRRQ